MMLSSAPALEMTSPLETQPGQPSDASNFMQKSSQKNQDKRSCTESFQYQGLTTVL